MAGSPEFPGEAWLTSIKIEQSKKPLSNWSIWRVPNNLRNLDEDAYIPNLISIGPLHHGTKNVKRTITHLLGLIHDSCLPPPSGKDPKGKRAWQFMHCATVLSKAGTSLPMSKDSRVEHMYITSYFILMDNLIDTPRDVELLVQKGVLENDWGGWEEVSRICSTVSASRYKADFKRDHCSNPWTIISLVAGSVLLGMTALQTVYTVLGYYQ
ncbi:hypothetical protein Tsubulata_031502 [Turnera subulata]|uniref:Uncharacterized protein n=1 Tax=Turnera subulata TaxID=218843 RepID=A0A9Q0J3H1_9ROSI|nr:hypothetical protein Tsubulata_031502 [Turnera subulata]